MPGIPKAVPYLPAYCFRRRSYARLLVDHGCDTRRNIRQSRKLLSSNVRPLSNESERDLGRTPETEKGAMSRKLEAMTDQILEESGQRGQKIVEEAGFSEDLKKRLEAKIQDGEFRSKNASAFATLEMPVSSFICYVCRWLSNNTHSLVLVKVLEILLELDRGPVQKLLKMLLCACSMMHTSHFEA